MGLKSLGQKTDYTDKYNPQLLERISRQDRRKDFKYLMHGYDIWNCYEVSWLDHRGKPNFKVLTIINPASSRWIWESKSLKLYLFSFNNTKFRFEDEVFTTVQNDLSKLIESTVIVRTYQPQKEKLFLGDCLDNIEILTNQYQPDKNILLVTDISSQYATQEKMYTNLLRSNCEITNQPDWARVSISYLPFNKKLVPATFLKYIISYRNHQLFHEPTCEQIYQDLYETLDPQNLSVTCQYTRRGGIDINPIRTSYNGPITLLPKLEQQ